ncbi:MAG: hypothetical protein V1917_03880 [Candidatus Gottesmanbacteria bacterium]
MRQYQLTYQTMIDENKKAFDNFFKVHERYVSYPQANQAEFTAVGREIQDIIHDYERRLCGKTEGGQFGKFSQNLSEKFWEIIRKDFPKIDYIGVTQS